MLDFKIRKFLKGRKKKKGGGNKLPPLSKQNYPGDAGGKKNKEGRSPTPGKGKKEGMIN